MYWYRASPHCYFEDRIGGQTAFLFLQIYHVNPTLRIHPICMQKTWMCMCTTRSSNLIWYLFFSDHFQTLLPYPSQILSTLTGNRTASSSPNPWDRKQTTLVLAMCWPEWI